MGKALDARGREIMDSRPARPAIRREKMQSLSDQMRSVVLQMRHEAQMAEQDSDEDLQDFDVDDDTFPRSPHELFVETPEYDILVNDIREFADKKKSDALKPSAEKADKKPSPKKASKSAEADDDGDDIE